MSTLWSLQTQLVLLHCPNSYCASWWASNLKLSIRLVFGAAAMPFEHYRRLYTSLGPADRASKRACAGVWSAKFCCSIVCVQPLPAACNRCAVMPCICMLLCVPVVRGVAAKAARDGRSCMLLCTEHMCACAWCTTGHVLYACDAYCGVQRASVHKHSIENPIQCAVTAA